MFNDSVIMDSGYERSLSVQLCFVSISRVHRLRMTMMSTLCCFAIVERLGEWSPEPHATASQQSSARSKISSNSDATHAVQLTFESQHRIIQPPSTSVA